MLTAIEIEQLIYLFIPIVVIIVGIYFLIIHKTKCPSCGRSIRPLWKQCSCASEPSTLFTQKPFTQETEEERGVGSTNVGSTNEVKSYSYDDAQTLSGEGTGMEMGIGTEVMPLPIPSAWLLIKERDKPEKRYDIKGTIISIGSTDDNDIVLKNKAVSRHHAKIRIEGKKHFVYDLASTNGTRVNGRKISKKWIKEGDSIEMGHTRITFKTGETPEYKTSDLLKI